jgi:hypothetical protein
MILTHNNSSEARVIIDFRRKKKEKKRKREREKRKREREREKKKKNIKNRGRFNDSRFAQVINRTRTDSIRRECFPK